MKNTDITEAVDALKAFNPTSKFRAFCELDNRGFDIDSVYIVDCGRLFSDTIQALDVAPNLQL